MFDLINTSALPQVMCLHSMCILGKHIERVARKQSIGKIDRKIDRNMRMTELLTKHIFPCVEYIEIMDDRTADHMFILTITRYNVKRLKYNILLHRLTYILLDRNLYNSNLSKTKSDICQLYNLRELSLINISGIDNAIDRMSCCKSLSKLDMSFNRITEFSKLYDILLNYKLQILNLSFNDIEYLKHVNETTSIILSKSILEVLDLSNNKLTLLTIQWVLTPSLRVLNCSFNQIRNVYFSGSLLYGNARMLSTLNLANNRDLTFEQNIFDSLTCLTVIDISETNISSGSLPETVANLCKIYLNCNSVWEYVRFTCKYNPEYEIYLSGNHIQNVRSVRMFYATSVLDISHNLLEDLLGSDCQDISQTKILNVSSNRIDIIDDSFSRIMTYLEELDLSNNPLRNIQRYDISANTRLQKLILANSDMHEININISLPWNVPLIDLRGNSQIRRINVITESICQYRFYAFEGWLQRTNESVNIIHQNCAKLQVITDSWSCEKDYKLLLYLDCMENIQNINYN
ncbi:hypothetical protein GJ496_008314 [Pomphorhynchus laevis]|nr:hypothetical protein GJ496_008314 [Pomphorhynchus laevis]